jgi:quercetin dioxygenase-like cupin family protein
LSEREILAEDFDRAIEDLREQGFRLDLIYPADEPRVASLRRGEDSVVVKAPGVPVLPTGLPLFRPEFVLTRSGAQPGRGRAGMLYRDLIPGRLGGRYVASHISITEGGPVSDWVHFHRVAVQLIVVRSGWVKLVYEDQGDPFVMRAGDVVLQPPLIRHQVLESSPGLEVVEVTAPALHETFADHELALPNGAARARDFSGQRFVHHVAETAPWTPFAGGEAQETAIAGATAGAAEVRIVRPRGGRELRFGAHDGELVFGFVLDGAATLLSNGTHALQAADAFVILPGESWSVTAAEADFRLLQVATGRLDGASASPL